MEEYFHIYTIGRGVRCQVSGVNVQNNKEEELRLGKKLSFFNKDTNGANLKVKK